MCLPGHDLPSLHLVSGVTHGTITLVYLPLLFIATLRFNRAAQSQPGQEMGAVGVGQFLKLLNQCLDRM